MRKNGLVILLVSLCLVTLFAAASCAQPAPAPGPAPAPAPSPAPAPAYSVTLSATTIHPEPGTFHAGVMAPWAKMVSDKSGGQIQIDTFPMGTFAALPDTYDAAVNGLVDIALTYSGFSPGRFPRGTVMQLPAAPFAVDGPVSSVVLQKLYEGGYLGNELNDVKVLWLFSNASPTKIHFAKPVSTIGDLQGKRIRVAGVVPTKMIEAVKGVPILMPPPDVYPSLEKGVIDAALFPYEAAVSYKFSEVAKYHLTEPGNVDYFIVAMNRDKWNSLPGEAKRVMEDLSGQYAAQFTGEVELKYENKAYETLKAAGDEFISFSPADHQAWRAAAATVWDWWVGDMQSKGIDGKAILAAAEAFTKEYK
ncbi:MAG: TRAP transporter substrate-binding protein [Chloroflexota bacterium]